MNWYTLLCDDRIRSYKKNIIRRLRTEFEKDYTASSEAPPSAAFRTKPRCFRWTGVSFVRTRLTHSLEVPPWPSPWDRIFPRASVPGSRTRHFA